MIPCFRILATVAEATENVYATVPEGAWDKLVYGLTISAIGMGMVFLILFLLMLVLDLFKLCFYTIPNKRKKKPEITQQPVASTAAVADQAKLIAVLAAAVAAYEGDEGASSRYRIRSFRRI